MDTRRARPDCPTRRSPSGRLLTVLRPQGLWPGASMQGVWCPWVCLCVSRAHPPELRPPTVRRFRSMLYCGSVVRLRPCACPMASASARTAASTRMVGRSVGARFEQTNKPTSSPPCSLLPSSPCPRHAMDGDDGSPPPRRRSRARDAEREETRPRRRDDARWVCRARSKQPLPHSQSPPTRSGGRPAPPLWRDRAWLELPPA